MKSPHQCKFVVSFVAAHRRLVIFCHTNCQHHKRDIINFLLHGNATRPNPAAPPYLLLTSLPPVLIPSFSAHLSKPLICKENECSVGREGVDNTQ